MRGGSTVWTRTGARRRTAFPARGASDDRYSYRSLREHLDSLPADVRIAVLDACASGAITRLKGGRQRQPFLVDESADMRGHAFLTSSSETEAAQESDRIGGSYFTHYLLSGLRGAADSSGEGKVTLNEAYQFAFNETLGRTVETKGGAQHPSYDINLSGSGDVVITDLRQTSATLVLGEALDGRFFVRNARQELVVELSKPYGRRIELGLEPGRYEVRVQRGAASLLARSEVVEGARVVLEPAQFSATETETTRRRGGTDPGFGLAGRNRLDLHLGGWRIGPTMPEALVAEGSKQKFFLGLRYTRFLQDDVALAGGLDLVAGDLPQSGIIRSEEDIDRMFAGSWSLWAVPMAVQWNPLSFGRRGPLKPYLSVGIGPVIGTHSGSHYVNGVYTPGDDTEITVGGHLGVGFDVYDGGGFALGFEAGYRWMGDFSEPVGYRDNYSGFSFAASVGWVFGKGSAR